MDVDTLWRPLLGGAVIGLAAALLWLLNGRVLGVSGILGGLLVPQEGGRLWRAMFLLGLLMGGLVLGQAAPAAFDALGASSWVTALAGVLVGVGTTLANGCTSGHGVCGVSRLSPRSLLATGSFVAAGMLSVYLWRQLGASP